MARLPIILAAFLAAALGAALPSRASMPVARVLSGCVVDQVFYSVNGRAYRIRTDERLDLRPLEGRAIALRGLLHPGDHFQTDRTAGPEDRGACPADALRLIRREQSVRLRVAARTAAEAGEPGLGLGLIARAMAIHSPVECDTYTDRAHILALQGDAAAVARDLAILGEGNCTVDGTMNWLLLRDLGRLLTQRGDRHAAVQALELALAACDRARCLSRPDIVEALAAARR